ncbi:MAG: DegV family protein [Bacillota bacterium]|nr:DegV family protein [Bacillota bacterium]HHT91093.1 DegV family protein [Bacillota bacterium]
MGKIHVVTDSGADLSADVRQRLGIHVVPLTVQFGDEIFKDGVEISTAEFYAKLESDDQMPSTCQPSPSDFVAMYERIAQPGDTIISVHLSSKMSGTYQSAVLASTMLDLDVTIKAVDSKAASMGLGLVAVTAAEGVRDGKDLDTILADVQHTIDSLQVYFVVDTLEYLKKNGRIGLASALVGTLLNIKPILTLVDGQVAPFEKIRGKAKALKRIQELVEEFRGKFPDQKIRAALSHAENPAEAVRLAQVLSELLPLDGEVLLGEIGSTIGVHTGPGVVALFLYAV